MRTLSNLTAVAMLAAAIAVAGCGGTSNSSMAASSATTSETEASSVGPSTPAEREEDERRYQEGQQVLRQAQTYEQQAAQERAKQQSAPDSHEYPPAVRATFIRECDRTSGHERSACECALERIEAKVPLSRFEQTAREVRAGHPLPFLYGFEIGYCASAAATSG